MSAHTYARLYVPLAEDEHVPGDAYDAALEVAQEHCANTGEHLCAGPPELAHFHPYACMPAHLIFPVMREVRT